jgi:hypothetical protein
LGGTLAAREEFAMPFPLIPTVLGMCFLLVWAFIGGMILRHGQIAARRERESHILPLPLHRSRKAAPRAWATKKAPREVRVRAAS